MISQNKGQLIINEERGLILTRTQAIRILDDFNIPYYENNKVHFKDVCKKLINKAFKNKDMQVTVGKQLQKRIKRGWKKKYNLKKTKRIKIHIQKIMAAKILIRWIRIYKKNKTLREGAVSGRLDVLQRKITQSLMDEVKILKDEEDQEISSVGRDSEGDNFQSKKSINHKEFQIEDNMRLGSMISEECNKFIANNSELFKSTKVLDKLKNSKQQKKIKLLDANH